MSEQASNAKFEQLYRRVFEDIVRGHFRPGDRIGIKDLAAQLKVSPTPLREVMSRLVGRGVVEERRSEGYYLARLDAQDITDFFRLHERCMLIAVKKARARLTTLSGADDAWSLFAGIAQATGDNAIIEMRALLDDRLAVVRRLEGVIVMAEIRKFAADVDERSLTLFIRHFHASRIAVASTLALHLVRGARP